MDGVTILAENISTVHWWFALIIALVCGVLAFIICSADGDDGILLGIICAILCFCIIYIPNCKPKTTYDVIIDDSVSMKEFNEHYEIIKQKGEIITVRLKEAKNANE